MYTAYLGDNANITTVNARTQSSVHLVYAGRPSIIPFVVVYNCCMQVLESYKSVIDSG